MRRRLFTPASVFSLLLLAVATCVMWVRSYWTWDHVSSCRAGKTFWLSSGGFESRGSIILAQLNGEWIRSKSAVKTADDDIDDRGFIFVHVFVLTNRDPYLPPPGWPKPFSVQSWGEHKIVIIKYPALATLLAFLPALWIGTRLRQRWSRRGSVATACPACGYDLRATPDRCPECGNIATASFSKG